MPIGRPRKSPTIVPSVAIGQSSRGPIDSVAYWQFIGATGLFSWSLGSGITDDDGATCIEPTGEGGQVGRFIRVRNPDRGADLTDADATIRPSGKRWRVLPAATLSANRILTLGVASSTESVEEGDWILITRNDVTAFTYTILNGGAGAGNVAVMPVSQRAWCLAWFDGTDWMHRASGIALGTS